MVATKLSRRFGDIREFLKIDFLSQNAYFSNNNIFSSFSEYTLLWDVNAKLLIQFEGLQMKVLIKIWNDPPKGDFCQDKRILIKGNFSVMSITSKIKKSLYTVNSTKA